MNIDHRQKLLALAAIAGVLLLAGDRVLFTPLKDFWKDRAKSIAEWKRSVARGTSVLEREQSIRSRWDSMRTNTLGSEMSVAENQVLQSFDRWSQSSKIGITAIKPQWKHATDDYSTLECRVDAFGNLQALTQFLYDIEKDPLGLKVELVEIGSRDDRGQQLTLGLQVSGLQLNPRTP